MDGRWMVDGENEDDDKKMKRGSAVVVMIRWQGTIVASES